MGRQGSGTCEPSGSSGGWVTDCVRGTAMYQMLCVLLATIVYGTQAGHCQDYQAGQTAVTFPSSNYGDMREILTRAAATGTVTVKATLGFPEQNKDRYPAVIVIHGLGGYSD